MTYQLILLTVLPLIAGLFALRLTSLSQRTLKLVLGFCGAYLLAIACVHLLPEVFASHTDGFTLGFWILGGFVLQIVLDSFTRGIEHGHVHKLPSATLKVALPVLIGLSVHSLLEGIPLGLDLNELHVGHDHGHDHHSHGNLVYWLGVLLHKVPAAVVLAFLMRQSGFSKVMSILLLCVFVVMSPLGAVLGLNQELFGLSSIQGEIMALVIGSFLHISTTIIFEQEGSHHNIDFARLASIILGMAFALALMFLS